MKKILLIEDDADLFALLKYNLEKEGYALAGSQTAREPSTWSAGRSRISSSSTSCCRFRRA